MVMLVMNDHDPRLSCPLLSLRSRAGKRPVRRLEGGD
jgi:hypothetical protein